MNAESYLINKYVSLPENLQQEVMDFIDFLVVKYQKGKQVDDTDGEVVHKKGKRKSNFGSARGLIIMGDDFDAPLDDFKEYM